jgi:molybdopterin-containing oxidoreductase family iron-sulfur binding subunit
MDPDAAVTKLIQADPRVYQVLDELNTKPGVIYLKRVIE